MGLSELAPPSAVEAEQQLVGAAMLWPESVMPEALAGGLSAEMFWDEYYQQCWKEAVATWQTDHTVSSVQIAHALKASGHPSTTVQDLLDGCITASATFTGVTVPLKLVQKAHQKREIGAECQSLIRSTYEADDPLKIVAESRARLADLVRDQGTGLRPVSGHLPEPVDGIEWGLSVLDHATRGIVPGELSVVAGGTGQGKTNLALHVVREVLAAGGRVAAYTLEMAASGLDSYEYRLIHAIAEVRAKKNKYDPPHTSEEVDRLASAARRLQEWDLVISDRAGVTLDEVEVEVEIAAPVDLVVIDYLQLMNYGGGHESEATKIGRVTRGLKQLARSLGTHVLLVSQFNRGNAAMARDVRGPRIACAVSGDKFPRPSMHSLLGSGSIEHDADKVIILQNHNYQVSECQEHIELILEKNRAGTLGNGTLNKRYDWFALEELDNRKAVEFV